MPAQLVALNDGPSILLDKPILLVGRHPECDIQIDSRKISRRHCCIAQVSDYLVVRDLGSTNGIRINGLRVVEGRLADGDELTLGNNRYRVAWDVVPSSRNPNRPPPKKQTIRASSPPADVEDELLESCDEPVPLHEPGVERPLEVHPLLRGAPVEDQPRAAEEAIVLPDELELLPNSDVYPKLSPHQTGSHPPV